MTPSPPVLAPRPDRRARVGLTPLIDVVFILLVFFMLASRLEDRRVLALDAAPAGAAPGVTGALLVELRPEGLRLGGARLTPEALSDRLSTRLAAVPDQRVLIRPSQGVPMQRMAALLDRLHAAGVRDVALLPGAR